MIVHGNWLHAMIFWCGGVDQLTRWYVLILAGSCGGLGFAPPAKLVINLHLWQCYGKAPVGPENILPTMLGLSGLLCPEMLVWRTCSSLRMHAYTLEQGVSHAWFWALNSTSLTRLNCQIRISNFGKSTAPWLHNPYSQQTSNSYILSLERTQWSQPKSHRPGTKCLICLLKAEHHKSLHETMQRVHGGSKVKPPYQYQ